MYLGAEKFFHLTYCTNIHPSRGWEDVFASLRQYGTALKMQFAPNDEFGIGLRLSGEESCELLQGDLLQHFQAFLQEQGLYVFTLNGFPYGPFHHLPVKAEVHAPDWREEERVRYTARLIEILAFLLPDGLEGSISTSPLSYKAWVDPQDLATWNCFTRNIVRIAEILVQLKQECGQTIYLAIEPEPDGLLENSAEIEQFYTNWLLTVGAEMLATSLSMTQVEACHHILEHIRVCLDTCHMAIAYEDPRTVLDRFERIGIKVGKVQLSSALKVAFPDDAIVRAEIQRALEPFAESTYLHQVIQRNNDRTFSHYPDLITALPTMQQCEIAEWRIHFHVPIFLDHFPLFQSTQNTIVDTLRLLAEKRFCHHMEIETYTWSVLPSGLKMDLLAMIAREYAWVLREMA